MLEILNQPEISQKHKVDNEKMYSDEEFKKFHRQKTIDAMARPDVKEKLLSGINSESWIEAHSGPNNHAWQDGRSFEPYSKEFNKQLKERIRRRDNYTCQFCERTEFENWRKYGRNLSTHHIDYDKKNSDEQNLISLCDVCHPATYFDREFWQAHYEARIREIYSSENVGKI